MSYLTFEVEIDRGQIVAKEPDKLPEKGTGLLTILDSRGEPKRSPREAWEALQKSLALDEEKAAQWMADIRDARR